MQTILPPKKDVALALLERASVFIHLDPRGTNVQVPSWFKRQPQLVLQVGLNMVVRIPDLDVGEDALSCTLSFNRVPHHCFVPWKAVYALVGEDGRGMVWPEDIPPEVAAQTTTLSQKPRLHSVASGGAEAVAKTPAAEAPRAARTETAAPSARGRGARSSRQPSSSSDGEALAAGGQSSADSQPGLERASFKAVGSNASDANRRELEWSAPDSARSQNPPVLSLSGAKRRRAFASAPPPSSAAQSSAGPSAAGPGSAAPPSGGSRSAQPSASGLERPEPTVAAPSSQREGARSAASKPSGGQHAGTQQRDTNRRGTDSDSEILDPAVLREPPLLGEPPLLPAPPEPVSKGRHGSARRGSEQETQSPAPAAERPTRSSERPYLRLVR
jgi:stringent starvation protein B